MKSTKIYLTVVLPLVLLAGCVTAPKGPSVMALPGAGKNFDQFRADDADCRQYALAQSGGADANQAATDSGLKSAAVGTAVGALAGAVMGGHEGAGNGAGAGLVMGSLVGTGAAQSSARGVQRSYDNAYVQCMYAKGEQVPVSGTMSHSQNQPPVYQSPAAPAGTSYLPPPSPPGYQSH